MSSAAMKELELRKAAECGMCGKKIGESGIPLFWRVRIERYGVDLEAVRRQSGLAMMLGGSSQASALARVMGPDEDMAKAVMTPVELTVCEKCGTGNSELVAEMAELGTPVEEEEE